MNPYSTLKLCDHLGCHAAAVVTLTAAYPSDETAIHPTFATYPAPMFRACGNHIAPLARHDAAVFGSTGTWLMRPMTTRPYPQRDDPDRQGSDGS